MNVFCQIVHTHNVFCVCVFGFSAVPAWWWWMSHPAFTTWRYESPHLCAGWAATINHSTASLLPPLPSLLLLHPSPCHKHRVTFHSFLPNFHRHLVLSENRLIYTLFSFVPLSSVHYLNMMHESFHLSVSLNPHTKNTSFLPGWIPEHHHLAVTSPRHPADATIRICLCHNQPRNLHEKLQYSEIWLIYHDLLNMGLALFRMFSEITCFFNEFGPMSFDCHHLHGFS